MGKEKRDGIKQTISEGIRKVLFVGALLVFLYSAGQLLFIWYHYWQGTKEYDGLQHYVTEEPVEDMESETGKAKEKDTSYAKNETVEEKEQYPNKPVVDFPALSKINGDIKGWISIPALELSYPVVQAKDNDYYLGRTFEHKKNRAGAIFIECKNQQPFVDPNTIIYGHNMKNGSMFGKLKQLGKKDKLLGNPYIWVATPKEIYLYEIFSVCEISIESNWYHLYGEHDEQFEKYIDNAKRYSQVDTGVDISKEDSVIVLSTCTSDDNIRFTVMAKRLMTTKQNNKVKQ